MRQWDRILLCARTARCEGKPEEIGPIGISNRGQEQQVDKLGKGGEQQWKGTPNAGARHAAQNDHRRGAIGRYTSGNSIRKGSVMPPSKPDSEEDMEFPVEAQEGMSVASEDCREEQAEAGQGPSGLEQGRQSSGEEQGPSPPDPRARRAERRREQRRQAHLLGRRASRPTPQGTPGD